MAWRGASLAKDEFNAARMIARPVFPLRLLFRLALWLPQFYKEPILKIGKKSPAAQAFPNHPNSWFILIPPMGRKAFWRITLPVLPEIPLRIRPITVYEMGQISPKDTFSHYSY